MNSKPPKTLLGIDYGEKRIGVALANTLSRLPSPLTAVSNDNNALQRLTELAREHQIDTIVVGVPRGLKGSETPQTGLIREFIDLLKEKIEVPVYSQDEDLTSIKAEAELKSRGVSYNKESVDGLAATYILEDYLRENPAKYESKHS